MTASRPIAAVTSPRPGPRLLASLLLAITLAGCASGQAFRQGERLLAEGHPEEAIRSMEQAVAEDPGNLAYRTALIRAREDLVNRTVNEADAALQAGHADDAERLYRKALDMHPENPRARAGLERVDLARRDGLALNQAAELLKTRQFEAAREKLRSVLAHDPGHAQAKALMTRIDEESGRAQGVTLPELGAAYLRRVSLEFRDAPVRTVFDAISQQTGLNFVFDKDVPTRTTSTISVQNVAITDAMDMLLVSTQLAKKVLGPNTLLIYPNRADKRRDYEDVMVKSFFLSNADAKQVLNMLRTVARIRDIYVDEKLNSVIVRDTPNAVRLAEKLVRLADQPEPEVVLDVEVLEVKRSKLTELGVQWPTQLSVLSKEKQSTAVYDSGSLVTTTESYVDTPLTLATLSNISRAKVGINPTLGLVANKTDGDVNILASPRIRVRNREKARIHVGEKVPVITSNTTSTGVVSESVSFLDVGLKLDVEPQVHLEGDVAIRVGMEVSNIVQEVRSSSGTLTYQLGSRNASTVLRLRDGETQVLAGLISEEDRSSAGKVPGLGDLPLIGRLFSSNKDENNKTEIVLLITPHIVRNVARPELVNSEFFAGTETTAAGAPMRAEPVDAGDAGDTGDAPPEAEPEPADGTERPQPPRRSGFLVPRGNPVTVNGGADGQTEDTRPAPAAPANPGD